MKKVFAALGLITFMVLPVQSFAWEYDGLGSLNPFTGFRNCNPCKCEKVRKPKLTKCETIVVPNNSCPNCMKAF